MIYIDRIITILNNEATIEQPIVLYKGDKNVQLLFTLKDNYLKYKSMENAYGQLIIKRPTANPIFSEVARLSSSKVTFIVTQEMIDELSEVGSYEFQIRLFSQDKTSRATLPPIKDGIIIREPILEEDTPNEVGIATVNETQVMAEDTELEVFDNEGNYNKTNWRNGDIISDVKLNKIEQAIYEINEKEVEVDLSTLATKEELNEGLEGLNTEISELNIEINEALTNGLKTKANKNHTHEEYAPLDSPSFTGGGHFEYVRVSNISPMHDDELITKTHANNSYATKNHIHSGYVTTSTLSDYAKTTDLHEHTNKTVLDGITQEKVREWNNKSDFSGNYDNLTNKPYIPSIEGLASEEYVDEKVGELETYVDEKVGEIIVPTKVSELENDSNFATQTYVSDAINKAQFEGNDSIDLSIYAKLEDLHEHENKTVLDGITEEKVTEWDNKAETNNPTFTGSVKIQGEESFNVNGVGLAIGEFAEANKSSLAVGSGTATGEYSVAFGSNVITNHQNQFVHGQGNIEDDYYETNGNYSFSMGKYAHIVGNGWFDNETFEWVRSNAYTLDWYGNGWYQGKLTIEGTPTEEKDVTTKLYVDTLISTKANEEHTHEELATKEDLNSKADLEHTHEEYTTNPTFTGYMSLNRKTDSVVGNNSIALGNKTVASGDYSTAIGDNCTANGYCSFVTGCGTTASRSYQFVSGWNNIEDTEQKYLFIVGNGGNLNFEDFYSNAYTLDWNGNGVYQGKLTVGVEPTEDKDVTTKLYVDTLISTKADKDHIHEELALKTELHEHENKTILDGITEETINTWNNKSEFDGDYNSLTNKPTIPSIEGLASEEYVDEKIANIEIKDNLETVVVESNLLALTTNKYQYVEISGDTEIVLPTVDTFKEIHLFFKLESDFANTIELSANEEIICQAELEFEGDYSYEIIATFIPNIGWLVGQVRYGEKLPCGLCNELECTCTSLKATDVEVDFAIAMKLQGESFGEYSDTMESNGYTFKQVTTNKSSGGWNSLTNKLEELGYVRGVGYTTRSFSAGTTVYYYIYWNVTLYGEPNITLLNQLKALTDTQLEQVKTYGKYN